MRVTTAPKGQEVALMKRKRHTPEQIIRKLREAERLLEEGIELPEVMRRLEISTQTYHRWKAQYHSMRPEDVVALKNLQKQNTRLKKIVADQALDIDMMKEVARGTGEPRTQAQGGPSPSPALGGLREKGLRRRRPAPIHSTAATNPRARRGVPAQETEKARLRPPEVGLPQAAHTAPQGRVEHQPQARPQDLARGRSEGPEAQAPAA